MYQVIFLLTSILSNLYPATQSAKILGIFPINSRSHHSVNQPIVKGLAAKGHDVTILSHFKSKDKMPNYTEILLSVGNLDLVDSIAIEDSSKFIGAHNFAKVNFAVEAVTCDNVFGLELIKQLVNSETKTFDLIIVEAHHKKCFHLLAHKLKIPLINLTPFTLELGVDYFIGNPNNPAVTPMLMSKFTTKMDFFQRVQNFFDYIVLFWYENYVYNKNLEKYAKQVFNMELPSDEELNRRTALTFYHNHFSFMARPKSPNVIDIGGITIKEPKKLPEDIAEFIEGSDHGVIYFSFGSTIKTSSITPEKLKIIMETFSAIPQRILWRVNELNVVTEVPPNVKLGKWFPQRDILEHENVIGFISHCGLLGTYEAIHTATPIIGMPFTFDQFQDINILIEKGVGIYVDYFTMDKRILLDAINEIVNNSKYRENMQKLSREFKDRPMTPLDEALYWVEYVLRHQGASHLRPQAADMPLYQYLLLDVFLLILSILIFIWYFCKFVFKLIISVLCRQKFEKNKTQ